MKKKQHHSLGYHTHHYKVFGLNILSEISLPELGAEHFFSTPDVHINLTNLTPLPIEENTNFNVESINGEIIQTWKNIGTYSIKNGNEILVHSEKSAQESLVRQGIYSLGLSALLKQRGLLVLHANAVKVGDEALLLLGEKGMGKSTLTAAFLSQGHPLISDDLTAVSFINETAVVIPGSPMVKLWPDSANSIGLNTDNMPRLDSRIPKVLHNNHNMLSPSKTIKLKTILILDRANTMRLADVSPVDKLLSLQVSRHIYRCSEKLPHDLLKKEFLQCSLLASSCNFYRFFRPWDLKQLDTSIDFLCKLHAFSQTR